MALPDMGPQLELADAALLRLERVHAERDPERHGFGTEAATRTRRWPRSDRK